MPDPDDPALRDFRRGDRIEADRFSQWQRRTLTNLHVAGGHGERFVRKGNSATLLLPKRRPVPAPIVRMRVTVADAAPDVALAERFDGTNATGAETPVRVYWMPEVGEEIFAFRPVGGTDGVYENAAVAWHEVFTLGKAQYDGQIPIFEGGQWVKEFNRAVAIPGF